MYDTWWENELCKHMSVSNKVKRDMVGLERHCKPHKCPNTSKGWAAHGLAYPKYIPTCKPQHVSNTQSRAWQSYLLTYLLACGCECDWWMEAMNHSCKHESGWREAEAKQCVTQGSQVIPQPSTNRAQPRLTSEFWWDRVLSWWYERTMTMYGLVTIIYTCTNDVLNLWAPHTKGIWCSHAT